VQRIPQTVTLACGLAASFALFDDAWAALGVRGARARSALVAALAAPAVWVAAFGVALAIALPTLLAELRRGGAAVAQQDLGAFGRAVREGDVWLTLAWTVGFAPVTEELLFRGVVWSAFRAITAPRAPVAPTPTPADAPPASAPASLPAELIEDGLVVRAARAAWAWLRDGGLATLGSAAVFGAMHLGVPGGAGIVRVVSAVCLGLACGVARHASGSLAAPIALHFTYNLVSVAHARGWLVTAARPKIYGVPSAAMGLAVVTGAACFVVARIGRPARAAASAEPAA
jgi:membrane protease YdiL (CAAX protease family)